MTTATEFQILWNAEEKENTHMVYNGDGISIISHGEKEANQIAEYMVREHDRKFTVEAIVA